MRENRIQEDARPVSPLAEGQGGVLI